MNEPGYPQFKEVDHTPRILNAEDAWWDALYNSIVEASTRPPRTKTKFTTEEFVSMGLTAEFSKCTGRWWKAN